MPHEGSYGTGRMGSCTGTIQLRQTKWHPPAPLLRINCSGVQAFRSILRCTVNRLQLQRTLSMDIEKERSFVHELRRTALTKRMIQRQCDARIHFHDIESPQSRHVSTATLCFLYCFITDSHGVRSMDVNMTCPRSPRNDYFMMSVAVFCPPVNEIALTQSRQSIDLGGMRELAIITDPEAARISNITKYCL